MEESAVRNLTAENSAVKNMFHDRTSVENSANLSTSGKFRRLFMPPAENAATLLMLHL
jgi:hypothetical protein